jgi:hypothetical protein
MATIKKANNKCWQGCERKGNFIHCVGISTATMEVSMEVPYKPKNRTPDDATMQLLCVYPKDSKSAYSGDTCKPFVVAPFHHSRAIESA